MLRLSIKEALLHNPRGCRRPLPSLLSPFPKKKRERNRRKKRKTKHKQRGKQKKQNTDPPRGEEGRQTQTPNKFPLWERGLLPPPSARPKLQTSLGLGRGREEDDYHHPKLKHSLDFFFFALVSCIFHVLAFSQFCRNTFMFLFFLFIFDFSFLFHSFFMFQVF